MFDIKIDHPSTFNSYFVLAQGMRGSCGPCAIHVWDNPASRIGAGAFLCLLPARNFKACRSHSLLHFSSLSFVPPTHSKSPSHPCIPPPSPNFSTASSPSSVDYPLPFSPLSQSLDLAVRRGASGGHHRGRASSIPQFRSPAPCSSYPLTTPSSLRGVMK
jgi:hypothetical protein